MYRYRTAEEIEAMCRAQGLRFSVHPSNREAVYVEGGGAVVWYYPGTGEFHGVTPWSKRFRSHASPFYEEAWHRGLCAFFWEWTDDGGSAGPGW